MISPLPWIWSNGVPYLGNQNDLTRSLKRFHFLQVLVEANVVMIGTMQRVAELDRHQTAALVVATAASGQMISFSGFLRSYLNVEDRTARSNLDFVKDVTKTRAHLD